MNAGEKQINCSAIAAGQLSLKVALLLEIIAGWDLYKFAVLLPPGIPPKWWSKHMYRVPSMSLRSR
jgi:hypothetical protein